MIKAEANRNLKGKSCNSKRKLKLKAYSTMDNKQKEIMQLSNNSNRIKSNIQSSHKASQSSRYSQEGLNYDRHKLSPKNFEKLMTQRGLSQEEISSLKASMEPGQTEVRHAKRGEKFITTHGIERSSGVFVSEKSLGATPEERIDKGALPHSNTAEFETKVELSQDQDLIYGKIAPQSKFSKMDIRQIPRRGGKEQVITNGGYTAGAVTNRDTKYPVPAKSSFHQRSAEHRQEQSMTSTHHDKTSGQKKSKGQVM